ncbi:MAG: thioredoxin family protein [Opitutaceae bacterium]|nr:thioredoxin family protein [Opitutaceae bacterium]
MNLPRLRPLHALVLATLVASALPAPVRAERPAAVIYDEKADASAEIAAALATAKAADKRVLLQFGANWCPWCHKLHQLFRTDTSIAAELERSYVVVLVDVNKGHNKDVDLRYGEPTKQGLPVLVVLDAAGAPLTTQETGALEDGPAHDPQKVLAFLREWAPAR